MTRSWTACAPAHARRRVADPLRVVLRDRARLDIEEAVDWYRDHADVETALAFVDAVEAGLGHLGNHPRTGSPRYATELDLPGLRSWLLDGFPYVMFYVAQPDHVDVWRVLHAHRDLPAWLREPESPSEDDGG